MGRPNPSRETKVSGANGDREKSLFPVQLTTNKIGYLTRLIHTLAMYNNRTRLYLVLCIVYLVLVHCHEKIIRTYPSRAGLLSIWSSKEVSRPVLKLVGAIPCKVSHNNLFFV